MKKVAKFPLQTNQIIKYIKTNMNANNYAMIVIVTVTVIVIVI